MNEIINRTVCISSDLLEIYNLYKDFCKYMKFSRTKDELETSLLFFNRNKSRFNIRLYQKFANTLEDFYDDIINAFSPENKYNISNAIAEVAIQK